MKALDFLLTIVHLLIIAFNVLGWIWPSTRKLHFYLVVSTVFCWVVLGFWFGFGYCPLTDWQWQVKTSLGEQNLPDSFIKYFADKVTGLTLNSDTIDAITAGVFGIIVLVTCTLYATRFKSWRTNS